MSFINRLFGGSSRSNMAVQTFRPSPAYERTMPDPPKKHAYYNPDIFWTTPFGQIELGETRKDSLYSIQNLIIDNVVPRLPNKGVVLELGAGSGFLREMIGDQLSEECTWIESDKTRLPELFPRLFPSRFARTKLPERIEAPDSSVSAIVGSGVLDTLPYRDMPSTMSEIFRVLKPGGILLHFLDMWPCRFPEAEWAGQNGMTLFPHFSIHAETGKFFADGFYYLSIDKLAQLQGNLSDTAGYFVGQLLDDPVNASYHIEQQSSHREIIPACESFEEKGCVVKEEPHFPILFGKILANFTASSGFNVEHFGEITSSYMGLHRNAFPYLPDDKNVLAKIHGFSFPIENDHFRRTHPDMVFNICVGQLLAARKL